MHLFSMASALDLKAPCPDAEFESLRKDMIIASWA
jgi:hypothetical protein